LPSPPTDGEPSHHFSFPFIYESTPKSVKFSTSVGGDGNRPVTVGTPFMESVKVRSLVITPYNAVYGRINNHLHMKNFPLSQKQRGINTKTKKGAVK